MARSRKPATKPVVSGPGSQSRRTDTQPVRDIPASFHGEAKGFADQQRAAPLPAGTPGVGVNPAGTGPAIDPFGPSRRPGEPVTAGAALGPGPGPASTEPTFIREDPDEVLRAIYAVYPHPAIAMRFNHD